MKVKAELTDTYCGEANYSWVRRIELNVPELLSEKAIVRRVKKELGLSGLRFKRRDNFGDSLALWGLNGDCVVLFINFEF
jgi:hypothetical protein